jgi:hypothetical protein
MASVDGTYVGPLTVEDTRQIVEDVQAGRPVLEDKQLARRPTADSLVSEQPTAAGPRMDSVDAPDEGAGPDPVLPEDREDEGTDAR